MLRRIQKVHLTETYQAAVAGFSGLGSDPSERVYALASRNVTPSERLAGLEPRSLRRARRRHLRSSHHIETGKPHASSFSQGEADLATKAVELMGGWTDQEHQRPKMRIRRL